MYRPWRKAAWPGPYRWTRPGGYRRGRASAKNPTAGLWRGHTGTMDLPRAEIRYRGGRAVAAAAIRSWFRLGAWLRPRLAPLAITALATICMLAGLDLIAHDLRRLRNIPDPPPPPPPIYLMRMKPAANVIPVELAPPIVSIPTVGEDVPVCTGLPR